MGILYRVNDQWTRAVIYSDLERSSQIYINDAVGCGDSKFAGANSQQKPEERGIYWLVRNVMNLALPLKIKKLIKDRMKSGKYRRPEDVVAAALSSLAQQESFGDFAKGELEKLLAVGERDAARGDLIDGDRAFAELRRFSDKHRKRAG